MRRLIALILACWFVLLGTGAVQYVHQLQHIREAGTCDRSSPWRDHQPGKHHDSDCQLCLQLHQPLLAGEWPAALSSAIAVVGWVTSVPDAAFTSLPLLQIVCRGPPSAH